jgi:hypothetical protein
MRKKMLFLALLFVFAVMAPTLCSATALDKEGIIPVTEEVMIAQETQEGVDIEIIEADGYIESAKQSFMKKEFVKAGEDIKKAGSAVERASVKTGEATKVGFVKSGEELKKLGENVEKGTVKSEEELKMALDRSYHAVVHPKKKAA